MEAIQRGPHSWAPYVSYAAFAASQPPGPCSCCRGGSGARASRRNRGCWFAGPTGTRGRRGCCCGIRCRGSRRPPRWGWSCMRSTPTEVVRGPQRPVRSRDPCPQRCTPKEGDTAARWSRGSRCRPWGRTPSHYLSLLECRRRFPKRPARSSINPLNQLVWMSEEE